MNKYFFSIVIIILGLNLMLAQEEKIGAMKTLNGTLIFYNEDNPHTIEIIGEVKLDNFPLIDVNDKSFQLITNNVSKIESNKEESLINYMNWEIDYLKETFPDVVKAKSEIINVNGKELNFWYYNNPIIEDAPKDITPYKMTFLLDWKKDNYFYKLVFPSFSDDVEMAKSFLLVLMNNVKYYSKKIDLDKLYENVQKGNNFYIE